jgi:hypothetical protein
MQDHLTLRARATFLGASFSCGPEFSIVAFALSACFLRCGQAINKVEFDL